MDNQNHTSGDTLGLSVETDEEAVTVPLDATTQALIRSERPSASSVLLRSTTTYFRDFLASFQHWNRAIVLAVLITLVILIIGSTINWVLVK